MKTTDDVNKIIDLAGKGLLGRGGEWYRAQRDVMEYLMSGAVGNTSGRELLAVLPTGFGKSLCYQVPGLYFSGVTIVISPLLTLIEDQTEKINDINSKKRLFNLLQEEEKKKYLLKVDGKYEGRLAVEFNSLISPYQMEKSIARLQKGNVKYIYTTPEFFVNQLTDILRYNSVEVSLIVIDEAHCVSLWGNDFRPSYRKIRFGIEEIRNISYNSKDEKEKRSFDNKNLITAAFTATAPTEPFDVRTDIMTLLGFKKETCRQIIFETDEEYKKDVERYEKEHLKREHFEVFSSNKEKNKRLLEVLAEQLSTDEKQVKSDGRGIVFCLTKEDVMWARKAIEKVEKSLKLKQDYYFSGRTDESDNDVKSGTADTIKTIIKNYNTVDGDNKIIVCTSAFGMGVDFDVNVDFLINYSLPLSVLDYKQQIGRAGRRNKTGVSDIYSFCSVKRGGTSDIKSAEYLTRVTNEYSLKKKAAHDLHFRKRLALAEFIEWFADNARKASGNEDVIKKIESEAAALRKIPPRSPENTFLINTSIKHYSKINLFLDYEFVNKKQLAQFMPNGLKKVPKSEGKSETGKYTEQEVRNALYEMWLKSRSRHFDAEDVLAVLESPFGEYTDKKYAAVKKTDDSDAEKRNLTACVDGIIRALTAYGKPLYEKIEFKGASKKRTRYAFSQMVYEGAIIDFWDCIIADAVFSIWREERKQNDCFTTLDVTRKICGISDFDRRAKKLNVSEERRSAIKESIKKLAKMHCLPVVIKDNRAKAGYDTFEFSGLAAEGYYDGFLLMSEVCTDNKNGYTHLLEMPLNAFEQQLNGVPCFNVFNLMSASRSGSGATRVSEKMIMANYYLVSRMRNSENMSKRKLLSLRSLCDEDGDAAELRRGVLAVISADALPGLKEKLGYSGDEGLVTLDGELLEKASKYSPRICMFRFHNKNSVNEYCFFTREQDFHNEKRPYISHLNSKVHYYEKRFGEKAGWHLAGSDTNNPAHLLWDKALLGKMGEKLEIIVFQGDVYEAGSKRKKTIEKRSIFEKHGLKADEALVRLYEDDKENGYYIFVKNGKLKSTGKASAEEKARVRISLKVSHNVYAVQKESRLEKGEKPKIKVKKSVLSSEINYDFMRYNNLSNIAEVLDNSGQRGRRYGFRENLLFEYEENEADKRKRGIMPVLMGESDSIEEGSRHKRQEDYHFVDYIVKAMKAMEDNGYVSNVLPIETEYVNPTKKATVLMYPITTDEEKGVRKSARGIHFEAGEKKLTYTENSH